MLHLINRQPRLFRNGGKAHRTIIRASFEHGLDERHEADFLTEEGVVFLQDWLLWRSIGRD